MMKWLSSRKTSIIAGIILMIGILVVVGIVFSTNVVNRPQVSGTTDQVIVPITGSSGTMSLSCGKTTIFKMDNGGEVSFPRIDPCDLSVIIKPISITELPAALPEDSIFVDATTVTVVQDGMAIDSLPKNKKVTISFSNHAEKIDEHPMYVIHWVSNEEGWQDVAFDSRMLAFSNETGVFVLVKR